MSLLPFTSSRVCRACAFSFCIATASSCVDPPNETTTRQTTAADEIAPGVLLAGSFEAVAKPAEGEVALLKTKAGYELLLEGVKVSDAGPVHVYLVGLNRVHSTSELDAVDDKYDFGALDNPKHTEQRRIKLPGKPAANLRSVALVNPKFGVVLASSELTEPAQ